MKQKELKMAVKVLYKITFISIIIVTLSCESDKQYSDADKISWGDFGDIIPLTGEVYNYNDNLLDPTHVLKSDTLIFLANKNTEQLLQIVNLNNQAIVGEYIPFGSGPEDMMRIKGIKEDGSFLYLYDSMLRRINVFNFQENNKLCLIKSHNYNYRFDDCQIIDSENVVAAIMEPEKKRLAFFTGDSLIKNVGEYPQIAGVEMDELEKIHGFSSFMVINEDKSIIAITYMQTDLMEFYTIDGKLLKRIHGPDYFFPEVATKQFGEYQKVSTHLGKARDAFFCPTACNEFFYVLYSGKIYNGEASDGLREWLLSFDWNGNPVARYKLDKPIFNFSLDIDEKAIYGLSDSPEYRIIKYKLPK